MADTLPTLFLERWLATIEQEYLSDYIRSGGSSVKVVSGSDAQLKQVIARVGSLASSGNYFSAHLDPVQPDPLGKRPDLHRIERFFFAVTQSVDWKAWAAMQAQQYLESRGIHLAERARSPQS